MAWLWVFSPTVSAVSFEGHQQVANEQPDRHEAGLAKQFVQVACQSSLFVAELFLERCYERGIVAGECQVINIHDETDN